MVEITDNKEMYHVKVAAIRQIITNIISYTHADNLTLIYSMPADNSQLTTAFQFTIFLLICYICRHIIL